MEEEQSSRDMLVARSDRITPLLCLTLFASTLGMFNFGWNTGVINNPENVLKEFYNKSYIDRFGTNPSEKELDSLWSITVSIFSIGGMIGALTGNLLATILGRRRSLMVNSVIGIIGGIVMGISKSAYRYELLITGRIITGINCGMYTAISPMYNSEIPPIRYRGGAGVLNQLAVTIGLFLSQILSMNKSLGTSQLWPLLFIMSAFAPVIQLVLLQFCPESPSYLYITKKDNESAKKALMRLRGVDDEETLRTEISNLQNEFIQEESVEKMSIIQFFKTTWLLKPLGICVVMHLSQQLTGIINIFNYSTKLFQNVGFDISVAQYATPAVGGIMVLMTLITVPLVDSLGRRILHLSGLLGMFFCSIVFTMANYYSNDNTSLQYIAIISALVLVAFFAIGPGGVPWVIVGELFAQSSRPIAVSISVAVNWLAQYTVAQTFPLILDALDKLSFVPFTVLLLIFIIILYLTLPETKNRTIEEMTSMFQNGNSDSDNDIVLSSRM